MLAGECTLIVEEERPLRQWDYFHCPPNTRHVFVGAGDGPCAILMIGLRRVAEVLRYPVSAVAAKYGASSAKETDEPDEAYADWPGEYLPVRLPWPVVPAHEAVMVHDLPRHEDACGLGFPHTTGHCGSARSRGPTRCSYRLAPALKGTNADSAATAAHWATSKAASKSSERLFSPPRNSDEL